MDRKGQDPTRGSKDAYWTTGHLWRSSGSCEKGSAERALIVCGRRDSYRHQWTASNRSRHTRGLGSQGTGPGAGGSRSEGPCGDTGEPIPGWMWVYEIVVGGLAKENNDSILRPLQRAV